MDKLLSIFSLNRATFYNYRTGARHSIAPRMVITALAAAILAAAMPGDLTAFLGSLITVQAVLVGFAFSVIFFLLSAPPALPADASSLEDQVASEKITVLSAELFHNVSYFGLVGMASLGLGLIMLMPDLPHQVMHIVEHKAIRFTLFASRATDFASLWGYNLLLFTLGFVSIESSFTFVRTIGRVSFLFEERARLLEVR